MGLSAILEIIIGLAVVYIALCIFCSGVNELIGYWGLRRGKFLREGLVNLIRDRWVYLRVISHPLVHSLYRDVPGKPRTPAYIPSANFANAVIDTVLLKASQIERPTSTAGTAAGPAAAQLSTNPAQDGRWTAAELRAAALACRDAGYTIGDTVVSLVDAAQGDEAQVRRNIEAWFDGGMQRVSGWYKRRSQHLLFWLGLAVAVGFNIDTLNLASELSGSAQLRRSLADTANEIVETQRFNGIPVAATDADTRFAQEELKRFASGVRELEASGLPLGYACMGTRKPLTDGLSPDALRACWTSLRNMTGADWLLKALGLLITALAVTLGAPFWFDLLNKLVNLRGAGPKPRGVSPPHTERQPAS
jgi:hypothetical protein